jgi:hypothetical protein
MTAISFPDGINCQGDLRLGGTFTRPLTRTELLQENLAAYQIPWTAWRVWDALQTNLPGTSAADDLALIGGTFGTGSPSIQTYDVKAAGAVTMYARAQFQLPPEYVAGETVTIRVHAGMLTTVASVSATVDVEAYESNDEAGIGSDLVTTSATTINSLTLADKDFQMTVSGLTAGDWLDIRITVATNDGATATVVKGIIGNVEVLCDIKG